MISVTSAVRAQGGGAALVRVDSVRAEPLIQTVRILGRLVPRQAGSISSRVDGPVRSVHVHVGDRVQTGQIVAEIDTTAFEVQHQLANARLGEANALLTTRKAELELARQEVKRLQSIKNSAITSRAVVDDAVQNVVIAEAKVAEAMAGVDSATASKGMVELGLEHTRILAPYAGVIVRRVTEAGAYVKTGETVVEIIADKSLEIEADIPFDRLSGVPPGTEVSMLLDDGTEHKATVRAIVPREDELTRTRATRFVPRFQRVDGPLAAGQSVTLLVPVGAPRTILSVHKDGVIRRQGEDLVYVVSEDVAAIRPVVLGDAVGSRFEVLGGLKEGDQVVIRGNERLRPNAPVRIDESDS